jgi:integrase
VQTAVATGRAGSGSRTVGQLRYAYRKLLDLVGGTDAEAEFARDTWRAEVLGIHTLKGARQIHFDTVIQPWLRAPVKRYARFRLATGKAFSSVEIDIRSVRWLSRFLTEQHPVVRGPGQMTRPVIEHYLSWLVAQGMAGHTTNTLLVCLRGFLETCRRYDWMPGLPATTAIYLDELPSRPRPLPRFVPEFVMAQIDDPANLARLPDDTTRHLLILIIETGLRANDACTLAFNPIIDDSVGWPCLRFFNHKMKAEQLVPLSATTAVVMELDYSKVGDVEILIPRSYGEEAAQRKRVSRARTRWTEADLFKTLEADASPDEVAAVRELYDWAAPRVQRVWWGEGQSPSVTLVFNTPEGVIQPCAIYTGWTNGVAVNFEWMRKRPTAALHRVLDDLDPLPTVHSMRDEIVAKNFAKRPAVPLAELARVAVPTLIHAIERVLDQATADQAAERAQQTEPTG